MRNMSQHVPTVHKANEARKRMVDARVYRRQTPRMRAMSKSEGEPVNAMCPKNKSISDIAPVIVVDSVSFRARPAWVIEEQQILE